MGPIKINTDGIWLLAWIGGITTMVVIIAAVFFFAYVMAIGILELT